MKAFILALSLFLAGATPFWPLTAASVPTLGVISWAKTFAGKLELAGADRLDASKPLVHWADTLPDQAELASDICAVTKDTAYRSWLLTTFDREMPSRFDDSSYKPAVDAVCRQARRFAALVKS